MSSTLTAVESEAGGRIEAAAERTVWAARLAREFERVVVAAHVPFLVLHLASLYELRPYYRFYPIWLAAVGWLMWKHWPRVESRTARRTGLILLCAGLACLSLSVWYLQPSLAASAALLTLAAMLVRLKGRAAIRNLTEPWLLLWLLAPPFLGLGDFLAARVGAHAAATGSSMLELIQVDHLRTGNSFHLPGQDVFAAEACSGVQSPLLIVALGILLAVVLRRQLLHGLLLVATAVFITWVLHTARIVLVVALAPSDPSWQLWLGYLLALIGGLLLLSTDRLLAALLAPVFVAWSFDTRQDPLSKLWNRRLAGPGRPPDESNLFRARRRRKRRLWRTVAIGLLAACRHTLRRGWFELVTPAPAVRPPPETAAARRSRPIESDQTRVRWTLAFGCVGALQLVLLFVLYTPAWSRLAGPNGLQQTWMPDQIGKWESVEYDAVRRVPGSSDGLISRSWSYRAADQLAHLSVDLPFRGWHELTARYQAQGWTVASRTIRDVEGGPYVAARMTGPAGESGYLLYSLFDDGARALKPGGSQLAASSPVWAHAPLLLVISGHAGAVRFPRGTAQVQLLVIERHLTGQAQRDADELYVKLRGRLLERWRSLLGKQA